MASMTPTKTKGTGMVELSDMRVSPFSKSDWHGQMVSHDDTPTTDFTEGDVAEVVGYGDDGDMWDGDAAGVVRLKDGRFVSWETFYGPTGDGFNEDAYGGDADIHFASDLKTIVNMGLTTNGRRLTGLG